MFTKIKLHLKGMLFGYPKTTTVMDGLTLRKLCVVYPPNINRPRTVVKVWNVAVSTVEPDEKFTTHAAWMLHIICTRGLTIANIACAEHSEVLNDARAYKEKIINITQTLKTQPVKR